MKNNFIKWVINCSMGELLGIGIAGSMAVALNYWIGEPQTLMQKVLVLFIMLLAGGMEGTSISWFQWKALRHLFPKMKFVGWWKWTILIALLGWGIGMVPSLFFNQVSSSPTSGPSIWLVAIIATGGGAMAGILFGLFQSFELKKHTGNWRWWIMANMLAWGVAMLIIFMGATWPSAATPIGWIILSAIVSGCLAGFSLGVITGLFLFKRTLYSK